jgi:transcription antitermination factor NusG
MIYPDATKKEPAPIRDQDMENFILITSVQYEHPAIEVLEPDIKYTLGEKVRVTEGVYKGAIGTVRRIRKDRKLLVSIPGVAVVAISHIPLQYLEKVQTC